MGKRLILSLCLTLFTSTIVGAVEPIGSLGESVLRQAHFLPDRTVLRVRADRIEIVNPDTNEVIDTFAEGLNWGDVTLSPDGRWLAITTDLDSTEKPFIEIWEIGARKLIRRLESGLDWIGVVAFSTAAPLLAVTYRDQIHLWNWEDDEYLGEMTGERQPAQNCYSWGSSGQSCSYPPTALSLVFSPDGNFLVVGSHRPDAEIWDVFTRTLAGHLEGHATWVSLVSYSPDGRHIATAEPESTRVYLWDAQTRQLIRDWPTGGSRGKVPKLLFSSDSQRLYVATRTYNVPTNRSLRNDRIRVWDVQTGVQLNEFGDELFTLEDFSLLPDEKSVLLRYDLVGVALWNIEHNRRVTLWADYLSGYDWELSPDGCSLVTVNSVAMKIWDVPSRSLRKVIVPQNRWFRRFAISPDSQTIAVGQDPWIELRDIYTGEVIAQFDYYSGHTTIAFSQTGKRIAAERLVLDIGNPENREVLDELGYSSIAFSAGDTYLASRDRDRDNLIHLWEQQNGKYILRYTWNSPIGSGWASTLAFLPSSDKKPVLAAGSFEQVNVWRIGEELEQMLTLDAMGPVRFSEDGQYLFCNGEDGLEIWDWREKKQIEHLSIPQYFAVSRDGSVFLTLDDETGQILIWDGRSLILPNSSSPGDVNRDGVVNILDLVQAASQFGQIGANLTGDVNDDGRVDVSDLGHIGSHLGGNAAAPSLFIDDSNSIVSYHSSGVNRQFQALAALELLENPSRGAHIARDLLRVWFSRMEPSVAETKLLPNYPNPFNPETWIPYQLSEAADVRIRIYDVAGHLVRELDLGEQPAGDYLSRQRAAYWDGRNDMGEVVSSGVYFYTLEVGDYQTTRRMTVVR